MIEAVVPRRRGSVLDPTRSAQLTIGPPLSDPCPVKSLGRSVAKALFSYQATAADDITMWADEEVEVIEGGPERNWWLVKIGDRIGRAPSNYLQVLPATEAPAEPPAQQSAADVSPAATLRPPSPVATGLAAVIRAKVEAGQITQEEADHILRVTVALTVDDDDIGPPQQPPATVAAVSVSPSRLDATSLAPSPLNGAASPAVRTRPPVSPSASPSIAAATAAATPEAAVTGPDEGEGALPTAAVVLIDQARRRTEEAAARIIADERRAAQNAVELREQAEARLAAEARRCDELVEKLKALEDKATLMINRTSPDARPRSARSPRQRSHPTTPQGGPRHSVSASSWGSCHSSSPEYFSAQSVSPMDLAPIYEETPGTTGAQANGYGSEVIYEVIHPTSNGGSVVLSKPEVTPTWHVAGRPE